MRTKQTIVSLLAVAFLICTGLPAWADFTVETTGIHEFELTLSEPGNTPRVMLAGVVTGDPGECFSGGTYNIRLDPRRPYYKEAYAMLVAAYLMNKHFSIGVGSDCVAGSMLMER